MNPLSIKLALLISASVTVHAKDLKLTSPGERRALIEKAAVWSPPPRLTPQDVFDGPKPKGYTKLLDKPRVYCQTTEEDQDGDFGGKTPKFYCQLLERVGPKSFRYVFKDNGDRRVIKVKYSPPGKQNKEIQGEILGTRLLWALGFYADRMFFVDEVACYGCTKNPYSDRRVAGGDPFAGKVFHRTAIESKISGDDVVWGPREKHSQTEWREGFEFQEMMTYLPSHDQDRQLVYRDALRLLAVFMQHLDLKAENQRLLCTKIHNGHCEKSVLMIQDLGASFGVTFDLKSGYQKVDLQTWRSTAIWKNPKRCIAQLSNNPPLAAFVAESFMRYPQISNSGRVFLAKLLRDFASDRRRIRALFQAARVDANELEDWVNTFLSKVRQITDPTGSGDPSFRCR